MDIWYLICKLPIAQSGQQRPFLMSHSYDVAWCRETKETYMEEDRKQMIESKHITPCRYRLTFRLPLFSGGLARCWEREGLLSVLAEDMGDRWMKQIKNEGSQTSSSNCPLLMTLWGFPTQVEVWHKNGVVAWEITLILELHCKTPAPLQICLGDLKWVCLLSLGLNICKMAIIST